MKHVRALSSVVVSGMTLAACQTASSGAGAARSAGVQMYHGMGPAVRQPFHTFNLLQDPIPPVLLRAESHPYDLAGVNSCHDLLDRVAELDLALGPDVDTPKGARKSRAARGADFAASTAQDAAGSALNHFIPFGGEIKQVTGAARYDHHVKHAVTAGESRRAFLKAVGEAHSCSWPAAPLDFTPDRPAPIDAPWSAPEAGPPAAQPSASSE